MNTKTITTLFLTGLYHHISTTAAHATVNIGTITGQGPYAQNLDDPTGIGTANTLNLLISVLIGFLTTAAGLFFMFQLLIAGYNWLSAGGDSGAIATARDRFIQAIIGLAIVVATYAITGLLGRLVGLTIFTPLDFLMP